MSPFHLAELVCISVDVQVGQRAETDHLPSASPLRHARSDFTSQSLANASHRRGVLLEALTSRSRRYYHGRQDVH